ncbi:MAG: hypothetical protein A2528_03375 [Candidatus Staskawiczbacteria bacterium RIFOXYD2_FULL_37_9]|uniref:DUF5659 domain-containing protein n=1 Tax=Candidatus Staskawiczbacteria bacterium RIFOXYB1_FULL_37_44 TaxID=1802223 RepID=A0A1G2IV31_9BACT|nr:MAG: hypothetical protein A2358_02805 [Candidatus Staskawiczbacteria bacterium RIFOXYB1_FULL_37_44]OGZ83854.1 MAG: hypothetical protein A2416_02520 [Candidatus Staskawiczbacteria bacterium RIFOXYC1_FULL_37_52]OGZ89361.1 MAG: hypothetical protein A2581_00580 [Candidatus Staskawiczbacteria bacterium RIFOXYD1_FULL_37_110]OGZ94511.1 MAG: hypothetical protein A2528_03375 [Candidatus Staskawiczbacteria bacterium RIFOXYD2_FULL_37_9]
MTKKLSKNQLPKNKNATSDNGFLSTYDLGVSASLITAGFELFSLDRTNPRKIKFSFYLGAGIEKVVNDYWANKLEIKARAFFDNIKMLKNRIYSN